MTVVSDYLLRSRLIRQTRALVKQVLSMVSVNAVWVVYTWRLGSFSLYLPNFF